MLYTVNRRGVTLWPCWPAAAHRIPRAPLFSRDGMRRATGTRGRFESRWGEAEWEDAILQGPHLTLPTPYYKSPNKTDEHNQDWSATDFEALAPDALPVTAYKPIGDRRVYDAVVHALAGQGRRGVTMPPATLSRRLATHGRQHR